MAVNNRTRLFCKILAAHGLNYVWCLLPISTPAQFHTGIFPGIVT